MDGKGIFVVFVATLCFSVMMTSSASPDESRDTSSLDSSDSSSSSTSSDVSLSREDCRLRPIIHQLKYPGCIPKSIPSFACQGHCSSYVQVSMRLVSRFLCDKSSYIFFFLFHTQSCNNDSHRSLDLSFGRSSDLACVVKKVENARQRQEFSVQNTNLDSERFV